MAKATIEQLQDAGFRAEQFGTPSDFDTAITGYLARVIDDAATLLRIHIGVAAYDAYTDDTTVHFMRLQRAELHAAQAELWARRAAFVDSSTAQSLENNAYMDRREYLKHADQQRALAAHWIDEFLAGGDTPAQRAIGDLSGASVITGPWAQAGVA